MLNHKFFFVRHGVTDWNQTRRFQGHQDVPLNTVGRNQALLTAKYLRKVDFDRIYTSDLSRARKTAEIIWKYQKETSLHETKELREGYGAELEGKVFGKRLGKSEIHSLNSLRSLIKNHGESLEEVFERTKGVTTRIVNSLDKESTIAIVSHGGPIRLFLGFVKGVKHTDIIGMKLGNCSITEISYKEDTWNIEELNYTEHLGEFHSKKIVSKLAR